MDSKGQEGPGNGRATGQEPAERGWLCWAVPGGVRHTFSLSLMTGRPVEFAGGRDLGQLWRAPLPLRRRLGALNWAVGQEIAAIHVSAREARRPH